MKIKTFQETGTSWLTIKVIYGWILIFIYTCLYWFSFAGHWHIHWCHLSRKDTSMDCSCNHPHCTDKNMEKRVFICGTVDKVSLCSFFSNYNQYFSSSETKGQVEFSKFLSKSYNFNHFWGDKEKFVKNAILYLSPFPACHRSTVCT